MKRTRYNHRSSSSGGANNDSDTDHTEPLLPPPTPLKPFTRSRDHKTKSAISSLTSSSPSTIPLSAALVNRKRNSAAFLATQKNIQAESGDDDEDSDEEEEGDDEDEDVEYESDDYDQEEEDEDDDDGGEDDEDEDEEENNDIVILASQLQARRTQDDQQARIKTVTLQLSSSNNNSPVDRYHTQNDTSTPLDATLTFHGSGKDRTPSLSLANKRQQEQQLQQQQQHQTKQGIPTRRSNPSFSASSSSSTLSTTNTNRSYSTTKQQSSLTRTNTRSKLTANTDLEDGNTSTYSQSEFESDNSELDLESDEDGTLVDINNAWVSSVQKNVFKLGFDIVTGNSTVQNPNRQNSNVARYYPPPYLHQICTKSTFIYGYRGLVAEMRMNSCTLDTYIVVGYRSSIFDRDFTYRGRGPRVWLDHLTPEEWLHEKTTHALADYTYTTDSGQIEILGLDQRTLQELLAMKNGLNVNMSSLLSTPQATTAITTTNTTTIRGKVNKTSHPQYQQASNSSVERTEIALKTIKTRQQQKQAQQQQKQAQRAEQLRFERTAKQQKQLQRDNQDQQIILPQQPLSKLASNPDPLSLPLVVIDDDEGNSRIPQLQQTLSRSDWKKLQDIQDQYIKNRSITSKSSDQLYDEAVAEFSASPEGLAAASAALAAANGSGKGVHSRTNNSNLSIDHSGTRTTRRQQQNKPLITDSQQLSVPTPRHPQLPPHELEDPQLKEKRVKHQGLHFETSDDLSVDDQARIRIFSVGDMPSLKSIYYAAARHLEPTALCSSSDEFNETFGDATLNFQPPGELIGTYTDTNHDPLVPRQEISFHLYLGSLADPAVNEYHRRAQPLLLFYIETASFIDSGDHAWEVLFCFQKTTTFVKSTGTYSTSWRLVGFTTLYSYLKFPQSHRLRLSQILVMPYAQRKGVGLKMLETVYLLAQKRRSYEVTIEDPSPGMQTMRDCCDVQRALALGLFSHSPGPNGPLSNSVLNQIIQNPVILTSDFIKNPSYPPIGGLSSAATAVTISTQPTTNTNPMVNKRHSTRTTTTTTTTTPTTTDYIDPFAHLPHPLTINPQHIPLGESNPTPHPSVQNKLITTTLESNCRVCHGKDTCNEIHLIPGRAGEGGCCGFWSPQQLEHARAQLYITSLQCERVMECICLASINQNDELSMREYRLRVKRRLMSSHKDQLSSLSLDDRKKELQRLYDIEALAFATIHRKLRLGK